MQDFINKYRDHINGTLSGFDRLVFRGSLRRLHYIPANFNGTLEIYLKRRQEGERVKYRMNAKETKI